MSKGLEALNYIRHFTNFQNDCYKDKLDCIEKHLKALDIIKRELVIEIKYNYLTEKYDVYIYGERGLGDMTKIEVSKEEGDILKKELV